jgi:hypothetical protein
MEDQLDLLNPDETAKILDATTATLESWRLKKRKPKKPFPVLPYIKIGGRVKYKMSDIVEFIEKCRINATPEPPPKKRRGRPPKSRAVTAG